MGVIGNNLGYKHGNLEYCISMYKYSRHIKYHKFSIFAIIFLSEIVKTLKVHGFCKHFTNCCYTHVTSLHFTSGDIQPRSLMEWLYLMYQNNPRYITNHYIKVLSNRVVRINDHFMTSYIYHVVTLTATAGVSLKLDHPLQVPNVTVYVYPAI